MTRRDPDGSLNLVILAVAAAACILCLWIASQPVHIAFRVLAGIAFAFLGNTVFALMHEAVHSNLHRRPLVNEAAGSFAAAFFPTSFTLQRAFHLAHHRNNRSDLERFDFFDDGQNRVLKVAQWYTILTGLYWLAPPTFSVLYALTAEVIPWQRLFSRENVFGNQTSSRAFIESVRNIRVSRVRIEVLASVAIQLVIIHFADVSLLGWCLCYGLFAINWSSLQYADHAFSCLDRQEGAWNLRVPSLIRLLFLNYHFHLVHHRDPSLPWRSLPSARRKGDASQSFRQVLLCMWAGPRPLPVGSEAGAGAGDGPAQPPCCDRLVNIALGLVFSAYFWILYASAASISSDSTLLFDLSIPGEDGLPFLPWTSPFYLSAMVLFCLAPLLLPTPEKFLPLVVTAALEVLLCWWIFVCLPFPTPQVPPATEHAGAFIFGVADVINLEGNNLPSLHVALTTTVAVVVARELAGGLRWLFLGWAVAVAISAILTRQHIVADVVFGGALAWAFLAWVYPRVERDLRDGLDRLGVARLGEAGSHE